MKRIFTCLFALLLLSATSGVWAQTALTSLEEGHVYRFVNRSTGRALNAGDDGYVYAVTVDDTSLTQQWYVTKENGYYVLRNLYYAKFLKGAHTNKVHWSLTDDYSDVANSFTLVTSDKNYNTLETKGWVDYGFMHDDGNGYERGYRVVSWENGDGNVSSHWTIHEVDYTATELQTILDERPTAAELSAKQTVNFTSLFDDAACCTPKHATLAAAKATDAYKALTADLQALVDKIYDKTYGNAGWYEDNADSSKSGWDSEYAKKFRVQMYEPYSIAGDITGYLRMNAHANNDNPTGVYVAEAGTVYVMVDGEIKEGATLRLHCAGSNLRITNATSGGYALNSGLNIINIAKVTDGGDHLYICYNVDTYNPDGATLEEKFPHKLSEYAPLKIHIEGGYINGFYNACGDYRAKTDAENLWKTFTGADVDSDEDWVYMETRANLSVLPILGHRQINFFQLNDENGQKGMRELLPDHINVPDVPYYYTSGTPSWDDYGMGCNPSTAKINIWMEAWDRIMHAELATLGLVSKSQMDRMNVFYPRWNSDGTSGEIYDYNNQGPDGKTYQEFCQGLDYSEYYNHHGVSLGTTSGYMSAGWHEANYNNNTFGALMNMPNNSGNLWGPVHEIGHQFQDVFNIRGATEVTNNVFSNAATWYHGMSTSRYNGSDGTLANTLNNYNTGLPFVDYNIWSMTQMFYKLWLYYHLAGNNEQFYPRFFEMLRVDPLNARGATATGTESMLKIYEKVCYAANEDLTEFFRAHGFFVLLDNYAKGDYGTTVFTQTQDEVDAAIARVKAKGYKENFAVLLINDGAEQTLQHDGKTLRAFYDGSASAEFGSVNDFIEGGAAVSSAYTATVNNDGSITMSGGEGGVGFLVFDEDGKLVSFGDKSTFALSDEAMEAVVSGSVRFVAVDTNNGMTEVAVDITAMQKDVLGALIVKAQQIIDKTDDTFTKIGFYKSVAIADFVAAYEYAKDVYENSTLYEAAYDLLYAEYNKILADGSARVPFDSSLTYIITNWNNPSLTMYLNGSKTVKTGTSVSHTEATAQWQFKETGTPGVYNVYNVSGYYCPKISQSTAMTATTTAADEAVYTLEEMEEGVWAIKLSPAGGYTNFHSDASWNVVGWGTDSNASRWYLTAVEPNATIADLADLEVYITKTEALLDEVLGDVTYTKGDALALQTTTPGSANYIWTNAQSAVEGPIANLVDGVLSNHFHTDYTSEPASGTHYIAVDLGSGNTLPRFTFCHTTRSGASADFPKGVDVYGSDDKVTYKYLGSASGMPQSASANWEYDGIMVSSHRYLRFNVHANRGYWHMAEFDIMPVSGFTATVNDKYSSYVDAATAMAAMEALLESKSVVSCISPASDAIGSELESLKDAYEALYAEYESAITERKATLAQLADETNVLIDRVGAVQNGVVAVNGVYRDVVPDEMLLSSVLITNSSDAMAGNALVKDVPMLDAQIVDQTAVKAALEVAVAKVLASDELVDGGVYRIMNFIAETAAGYGYHFIANSNAAIVFPTEPATDNSDLWVCKVYDNGTCEFVSALGTLALGWKKDDETAYAFTVAEGTMEGAKRMMNGNIAMALTNEKWKNQGIAAFNHATNGNVQDTDWSTDWFFKRVDDADIAFSVKFSNSFSSLYLPYSVTLPEGIAAFTAVDVDGTDVTLVRVADTDDATEHGSVLPARTPAILYIDDESVEPAIFTFAYTADNVALQEDVKAVLGTSLIDGRILKSAIGCEDGYRYYKLGRKSGDEVSKMYWMYKEYSSDGTIAEGNAGTDKGGYISCSANKIYMKVAESTAAGSFSMRFGEGTTGISEVKGENGKVEAVYDLQGRKVETPAKGLYIINGKKVLVK